MAAELDATGIAAPPRLNGSLVFAEPWESRVFGITMALHEAGRFEWEDFRQRLISDIKAWEDAHPDGEGFSYYEQWLAALQSLVCDRELVSHDDFDARVTAFAARTAGHDHAHEHAHEHGHR
jgi:nitrile hydratase accessory protein